jgi:aminoglycoside phosphotransferase
MLSGVPEKEDEVVVPAAVRMIAAGRRARPVWLNVLGGTTFEVSDDTGTSFVKFAPAGSGLPLAREAERLAWAQRFTPVPRVLSAGSDSTGTWLQTAALPGRNAVDARWLVAPGPAVVAIGRGLRALHDALPVETCPFSWMAEDRLASARIRAAAGLIRTDEWHPDFQHLTVAEALAGAVNRPPIDRLVVCHGDACAPNTLVGEDGQWTGHVDMATLGVADRWADLAIASWSLGWNFGPGWEATFYAAYGIAPDPERIAYYRLLWELGP